MPSTSVIIPALNEQNYLGNLLSDLADQTVLPDEVIVADCKSEDETLAVANSFAKKLPLKTTSSSTRSPGAARNSGARAAKSDYVLFIDADMRLPADFVQLITQALDKKPVDYLTPGFKSDGGHWMDRYIIWLIHRLFFINMRLLRRPAGIGGAMCVRRDAHRRLGGFDASKQWQDDIDYIKRLRRLKPSFTYLSKLSAVSSSRRFAGKGVIGALAVVLVDHSHLGMWLLQPLMKRRGGHREYGHYEK